MKSLAIALSTAAVCAACVSLAMAQPAAAGDKAQARAERKAQGAEAAREFQPGEGNPIPESRPKVSRAERAKAREERKPAGTVAAHSFQPGEGNPKPEAAAKLPREQRRAERSTQRAEVRAENKSGRIPNYGEGYGGSQK